MLALAGKKVLDLSRVIPGPLASLVLADLGATVDRIEDGSGDRLRRAPPRVGSGEDATGAVFLSLNRNKRSAILDVRTPKGRDALLRLVRHYDVLIEQYRPGGLDRLGLSHAKLRAENPGLVVCSLTGYGQNGPLAPRAGHDLNYLARAGILEFLAPGDGEPPTVPGVQLADVSGALFAVIGILAALLERERTGVGKVVDVSMSEAAMPLAMAGFGFLFGGRAPERKAAPFLGGIAPYATYATKDGRSIALGIFEPKLWSTFCRAAGIEEGVDALKPGPHQAALRAKLRGLFASRTQEEWTALADAHDCSLDPVLTPAEARSAPHLAARGVFFELDSPWGRLAQMRMPVTDRSAHTPPPRLGEHTGEILREAGFSTDDVRALQDEAHSKRQE
jgi:alpha-methylacyl-CoA racemase